MAGSIKRKKASAKQIADAEERGKREFMRSVAMLQLRQTLSSAVSILGAAPVASEIAAWFKAHGHPKELRRHL